MPETSRLPLARRLSSTSVAAVEIVAGKTAKIPENVPESLVEKIWKFLKRSKAFSKYNYEDVVNLIADLETWKMPEEIERSFPYYHAGYDHFDRPIWVLELADCDFLSIANKGKEAVLVWEKSIFLAVYRMIQSMHAKDTPEREITQCVFLSDFKGFSMSQVVDPQCLTFLIRMARKYSDLAVDICGMSIVVNMHVVVQAVSKIFLHIFRSMMDRVAIYGTNSEKWIPHVKKLIPLEAIPTAFGGNQDFVPLKQYGRPERKKSIVED